MFFDELLEIRLRDQLGRWMPDKFAAELKLAHAVIVLSFRAKSRDRAAEIKRNASRFFDCPGAWHKRLYNLPGLQFIGRLKFQSS
jgi:hypothetical protein